MLVVTVELLPGGFAPMRRSIAVMQIANISDLADISDYRVTAVTGANPIAGSPPAVAECDVLRHDRRQSVWALLRRACEEIMNAPWAEV